MNPHKQNCFVAGTPVWCVDGLALIESIQPGMRVFGYDMKTKQFVGCDVLEVDEHEGSFDLLPITVGNAQPVWVTTGHWFYTGEKWVRCEHLHTGVEAITASTQRAVPVSQDQPGRTSQTKVYNIRTELENYLIGGSGLIVSGRTQQANQVKQPQKKTPLPHINVLTFNSQYRTISPWD